MKTVNILLIEDNTLDAIYIKELLQDSHLSNYNLLVTDTLKSGLELLQKGSIDIILLDLNLPDSVGQATFKSVFNQSSGIPIIIITDNNDFELALKLIQLKAQDYISKTDLNSQILEKSISYSIERNKLFVKLESELNNKIIAEDKINKIGLHYQTLIEKVTDGIVLLDAEGQFKFVSSSARKMFGYSDTDIILVNPAELTHPDDLQMVLSNLVKLFEDPSFIPLLQYRFAHKKGNWIWVETTFSNYLADQNVEAIVLNFRDITERKLAEEKIKIFSNAVACSIDAIAITDTIGSITYINPAFTKMYGYESDEILGKLVTILSADPQNANDIMSNMIKTGSWKGEIDGIKKNKMIFPISLSLSTVWDNEGNPIAMMGTCKDITDQKLIEFELKKSEENLRTVIGTIPDLVWMKDPDGVYLKINQRFESLFGAKEKEIIGKTDYDFVDKDLADFFREKDNVAISAGKPTINEELVIFADDGHQEILETIKTPIFRPDGKLFGVLGIGRDISERKRAEEEIKFKNLILTTQQETSIDGILVVDEKGQIMSFNQKFVIMWNIPSEVIESNSDELAIKSVLSQLEDPQQFINKINYLYDNQSESSREEITLKDRRKFDRYSAPMFGVDSKYYGRVWYFRDITERKLVEEKLLELNKELNNQIYEIKSLNNQLELNKIELLTQNEELQNANHDLLRFNRASEGREIKMISLKREINDLLKQMDKIEKYKIIE
jgi:PAS domain S-box-containing protein